MLVFTASYLFTNKLKCSECGRFLGGCATTKPNGKKYYYIALDRIMCLYIYTNINEIEELDLSKEKDDFER